ncbi:collagen repeat protein with bclb C-terminal domain [Saudi moumouvirus]|nr:collagen repeat protein with bclb C-terminal domain [Saudi moumouvirus]
MFLYYYIYIYIGMYKTRSNALRSNRCKNIDVVKGNKENNYYFVGPQGLKGETGSRILTEPGSPSPNLGRNGDVYIDTISGGLYNKNGGYWILQNNILGNDGDKGDKGERGSNILTGTGLPRNILGNNGDIYIDNNTGAVYRKINNTWVFQYNTIGIKGDKGDTGSQGVPGQNGSQIITRPGVPDSGLGNNGDIYIDTSTGDLYIKIDNVWVLQYNINGVKGDKGDSGSQIITGDQPPSDGIGQNGDIYIDNSTNNLYRKINNVWVLQSNISGTKGDKGDSGSQIITGDGSPNPETGQNGDIYIDNSTGDLYIKVNNVWVLQSNIDGEKGDKGDIGSRIISGTGIPDPTIGNNGDIYIDDSTNNLYQKLGDVWILQSNLSGDKGDKGDIGSRIITGTGVPSPDIRNNGDIYIDNSTNNFYQKIGDTWVLQSNLTGTKGDKGDLGSQIFTGTGAPPPELGTNNDVYLDTSSGYLYQNIGGLWAPQINLIGPKGDKGDLGSQIFTGSGVPPSDLGTNNDVYLDTSSGYLYQNIGGIWAPQINLIGDKGDLGDKGDKGDLGEKGDKGDIGSQIFTGIGAPDPTLGTNGDVYLDNSTGYLYQNFGGLWAPQTNLTGPKGDVGDLGEKGNVGSKGDKGDIGSQIFTGIGIPNPFLGVNGDVYLNNTTGDLYRKAGGVWTLQTNLTGPEGDKGDKGDLGDLGTKGDKGDLGTPGTPGLGAIIPYSSGLTPVALATVLSGGIATTGAIYDFGVSVPTVELVGLNIDFTGVVGGVLPNTAWTVPRSATITSIATAFQNTADVDLTIGGSVFIRTQLYRETPALPGVFIPIPGTIVEVALPSALILIGFVARGITTGLNIPVAAGDRLILFANTRSTALITVSVIAGYLSSGVSLS